MSSLFAILGYYYIDNSIVVIFIGIFLGRLHVLSIFPIIVNSIMKNREKNTFSPRVAIYSFIILGVSYLIGIEQQFTSWWRLFFIGGVESLILLGVVYMLLLKEKNQTLIKNRVLKLIKKSSY